MTTRETTSKPFTIEKRLVYEAYKAVKSNKGAAGVDGQTLEQFEADLMKLPVAAFLRAFVTEHWS